VLVATGQAKAAATSAMRHGPVTSTMPASFLQEHSNVTLVIDADAASAADQ
jgi:glucosamine-6-phosphate deaminase